MEHWCKYLAVRLWTTLILGGLATLVVLLPFASTMGPEWMLVPCFGILAASYWLTGVGFAALGRRRIRRLMEEAKVWERAGMAREVRQVLARALNTVDSFYFSPTARNVPAKRLLAQTARFQMAQSVTDSPSDDVIEAYLISFPQDREVAVKWLEGVLAGEIATRQSHDIAARIKEAHENDRAILQMVGRFFINERCCDLTALQTYRQLMGADGSLPDDLITGMADLFLSQSRVDTLALKLYLGCYERGDPHPRLLQGIAACSLAIRSGPMTTPFLDRANAVLANIDASRRNEMKEAFIPDSLDSGLAPTRRRRQIHRPAMGSLIRQTWIGFKGNACRIAAGSSCQWERIKRGARSNRVKAIVKWSVLGISIVGVALLVINTIMHLSTPPKTVESSPAPVVVPVTDPFTIQVAAYLKEAEALRYVERLKEIGMDAYWTRASGGGRTWYQVRISHFETKVAAKVLGEDLKTRGIIDDYYVANYNRPEK